MCLAVVDFSVRVISCPTTGNFTGGAQGDFVTADIVLELVGDKYPIEYLVNAPTVS